MNHYRDHLIQAITYERQLARDNAILSNRSRAKGDTQRATDHAQISAAHELSADMLTRHLQTADAATIHDIQSDPIV
jgi:hypothetical protein